MLASMVYCNTCGAANQPQARFCTTCRNVMPAGPALSSLSPTGLLAPHWLLKGSYSILSRLGQGGMGAVYKATDTQLGDRLVAVKEMSQKGLDPQELAEAIAAFQREAHMLAGLLHPNLPHIYDHFSEAGRWYLVMDFIAGETLEEHLDTAGGRLPVEEVLDIGIQLCTVLNYLHTHQPPIIFRDLKPANIMLTPGGHVYLVDFGIARHFKPGQAKDTTAFGSAGYAAPEQYGKAQSTPRTDIYALGAVLYQLLTGNDPSLTPFKFAPIGSSIHALPYGLENLIMQMVECDSDKRPVRIAEVEQKLKSIVAHKHPTPLPVQSPQPAQPVPPRPVAPLLPQPLPPAPVQPLAYQPIAPLLPQPPAPVQPLSTIKQQTRDKTCSAGTADPKKVA